MRCADYRPGLTVFVLAIDDVEQMRTLPRLGAGDIVRGRPDLLEPVIGEEGGEGKA